jgi:arsenite methyltransferase
MTRLAVYDPPMCCSTGVCGPVVDPVLPRIAADLDWLRRQGIEVQRYNLGQQPQEFASNPAVMAILREQGNDCLPLVLVDGAVVCRGTYPDRAELARLAGVETAGEVEVEPGGGCCSSPGVVPIGKSATGSGSCC